MYVCMHVCKFLYMQYMCVYVKNCKYLYICKSCMYERMYVCMYESTYICVHVYVLCMFAYKNYAYDVYTNVCMNVCI